VSRESILQRIRSVTDRNETETGADSYAYRIKGELASDARANLLVERLQEYDARVVFSSASVLPGRITDVLHAAGKRKMVVPVGLPKEWRQPGIEWLLDRDLSYAEIDGCDGVLTGATVAVAESGSIVLQHGPAEGRRALTLLPDYHLCVIAMAQIAETLPEAFARLRPDAPTTFISGPSATADIEMTRVKGVHGPRFLDVMLLTDGE
jgi:L-lactate dehydrogenase complex protein LldG